MMIPTSPHLLTRGRYWNPRYSRARQPSAAKGQGGMNFLEAIFSFVFGDPDPNIAFEAQRWEKVNEICSG